MEPFLYEEFTMIKKFLNRVIPGTPQQILTGDSWDTARLRVDVGQTGFWEGREFRLNQPMAAVNGFVIKIVAPINFVLQLQRLTSEDGKLEMRAYRSADGVEGGTFSLSPYYSNNNQMSDTPNYVGQVQAFIGGSFTPTDVDSQKEKIVAKAATATAQIQSVGGSSAKERGLPSETYYLVFSGGGTGIYDLILEERP
ncbi:hypothetical protein vBVnaSL3_55 [Vibrio phage vB_VnaS-L3]|nr:hypothetical protein vBVnaSL3_55 [Vibrio phage vB_VnaS-L3]